MKAKNMHRYYFLICCLCYCSFVFSCGGGWAPYVPFSGSGNGQQSGLQSAYNGKVTFEKGVTYSKGVSYNLFDPKVLQPIIRNIILNGNERKTRHTLKKSAEGRNVALTADPPKDPLQSAPASELEPVLNIQGLQ
jgi:hypothetical protein